VLCRAVQPWQAAEVAPIVARFKAAEKRGNKERAAAAAALEPWLSPEVLPAVKEATIRTLVAAGVAPGKPQAPLPCKPPAPMPVKAASWSGCLQQQLQQAVQAGHAYFRDGQQPLQDCRTASCSVDMEGPLLKLNEAVASPNR
jgi:hypothetical protein